MIGSVYKGRRPRPGRRRARTLRRVCVRGCTTVGFAILLVLAAGLGRAWYRSENRVTPLAWPGPVAAEAVTPESPVPQAEILPGIVEAPSALETEPEPVAVLTDAQRAFRAALPDRLEQALFAYRYWGDGLYPWMDVELDLGSIPQSDRLDLAYQVLEVRTPEGQALDLRRVAPARRSFLGPYVRVPVPRGTPADRLGSALVRFYVSMPPTDCAGPAFERACDLAVDLNRGLPCSLSGEPEVPERARYDDRALADLRPCQAGDLEMLAVRWTQEQDRDRCRQVLSVALPDAFAVYPTWTVYAHVDDRDRKERLWGSSGVRGRELTFQGTRTAPDPVTHLSGRIEIKALAAVRRLTVEADDGRPDRTLRLADGQCMEVRLDRNVFSYRGWEPGVVQVAAYDDQGRRLRQDTEQDRREGAVNRFCFWGLPRRVVLDVATEVLDRELAFDLTNPSPEDQATVQSPLWAKSEDRAAAASY